MCGAVLVQFRITQMKMALGRMILGCGKLAMEFVGADVRRVLVAHAAGIKCCIGDGDDVFAGFGFAFPNGKSVLADEGFCLEADELNDDVFAHEILETESLTAEKKKRTGVCRSAFSSD